MGVRVDETGNDNLAARVYGFGVGVVELAPHLNDAAVANRDVAAGVQFDASHRVARQR